MRATSGNGNTGRPHEAGTVVLFRTGREEALLRRVRGEYREMPAMRLTIDQAMRLWDLDRQTCSDLFASLVAARFLDVDDDGRYGKAHFGY